MFTIVYLIEVQHERSQHTRVIRKNEAYMINRHSVYKQFQSYTKM